MIVVMVMMVMMLMMLVMMNFMKRGRVWTDNNDNTAVSLAPPQKRRRV